MHVLLIGALNQHKLPRGGEEYKNQLMHIYLDKAYTTSVVDTHKWKKRPFIFFQLFGQLFFKNWDSIIISASSHSVYYLVRLLQHFPSLARKTIYFVIGGYFPSAVSAGIFKKKPYESLKALVVEGSALKETLIYAGLKVVIHVVPNFKLFPKGQEYLNQSSGSFKFVFLSRVHPDKGVEEIIKAERLLSSWGFENFTIVFFGPIEEDYRTHFESLCSDKIHYGGILDIMNNSKKAYEILAGFDVMLFPTFWRGEGFPGALVDAFVAGLPVIASDWNMNQEVIQHEHNGLLIPPKDSISLAVAMRRLMTEKQLKVRLSENSKEGALCFHIDKVWSEISKIIEQ